RSTPAQGCEFFVWLQRGGLSAAASLSPAELAARRLSLLKRRLVEVGTQIDWLLKTEPDLTKAHPEFDQSPISSVPKSFELKKTEPTITERFQMPDFKHFFGVLPNDQNALDLFTGECVPEPPDGALSNTPSNPRSQY